MTRPGGDRVQRFHVLHRILHFTVMIGFIGLGVTGFAMKFGDQWWARAIAWCLGGGPALGSWHRFLAVMTYASVFIHLLWLAYYKLVQKGRLTGPNSMLPRGKDLADFKNHVKYFFARGPSPRFDRFTYWEKIDYWAVLLGMHTMGVTGLLLWFPEFFTRWLPGYFINLALVVHLYEAVIAVALKFVVHIVSAHLRPGIFPMEKNIFTGFNDLEWVKHEHPGQYEALMAEDETAGEAVS